LKEQAQKIEEMRWNGEKEELEALGRERGALFNPGRSLSPQASRAAQSTTPPDWGCAVAVDRLKIRVSFNLRSPVSQLQVARRTRLFSASLFNSDSIRLMTVGTGIGVSPPHHIKRWRNLSSEPTAWQVHGCFWKGG